jgi:predicted phosphatase
MNNLIKCIIFDYYKTLSNDYYFNLPSKFKNKISEILYNNENNQNLLENWWKGNISSIDIVNYLSKQLPLKPEYLLNNLKFNARKMKLNKNIFNFSKKIKNKGYYSDIVSINSDIFTTDVVPGLKLYNYFDCIINSSDYKNIEKNELCKIAINKIDKSLVFKDCLLIDDKEENIKNFQSLGGFGYQYIDDIIFKEWLNNNQF